MSLCGSVSTTQRSHCFGPLKPRVAALTSSFKLPVHSPLTHVAVQVLRPVLMGHSECHSQQAKSQGTSRCQRQLDASIVQLLTLLQASAAGGKQHVNSLELCALPQAASPGRADAHMACFKSSHLSVSLIEDLNRPRQPLDPKHVWVFGTLSGSQSQCCTRKCMMALTASWVNISMILQACRLGPDHMVPGHSILHGIL